MTMAVRQAASIPCVTSSAVEAEPKPLGPGHPVIREMIDIISMSFPPKTSQRTEWNNEKKKLNIFFPMNGGGGNGGRQRGKARRGKFIEWGRGDRMCIQIKKKVWRRKELM